VTKREEYGGKEIKMPACGLYGKSKKPRGKIECCGNWVCGNENEYVLFSYSRNICSRNHRRFTLCGFHNTEGHMGDWKICKNAVKVLIMN